MHCKPLLPAALSALCAGLAAAQQPTSGVQAVSLNSYWMHYEPPVVGVPVSGIQVVKFERTLANRSDEILEKSEAFARDSGGRIRIEVHEWESLNRESPLVEIVVVDPETRNGMAYEVRTHIAHPIRDRSSDDSGLLVKEEDLGQANVEGLNAKGTRRTFTIPAEKSGTGAPLTITDESWYSEDLHLFVLTRHTDPRIGGVETCTVIRVTREEPPESWFQPEGYRRVDATNGAAR